MTSALRKVADVYPAWLETKFPGLHGIRVPGAYRSSGVRPPDLLSACPDTGPTYDAMISMFSLANLGKGVARYKLNGGLKVERTGRG
jgi:hypothetical protein